MAILISDKIYFKPESVTRDKVALYTDTGIIHQEDIKFIIIHVPTKRVPSI